MEKTINLNKIEVNPFNERKKVEIDEDLNKLKKVIKRRGFLGSLTARPHPTKKEFYQLAYGARRLMAAKLADVKGIRLDIKKLDDQEMRAISVMENAHRKEVPPLERAQLIQEFRKAEEKKLGEKITLSYLAIEFGLSEGTISMLLSLLDISKETLDQIEITDYASVSRAKFIGGEEMVKRTLREDITQEDLSAIARTIKKFPQHKEDLISGKMHPDNLLIASIRKTHMSHDQLAAKLVRSIRTSKEAVELFMEELDNFSPWKRIELEENIKELILTCKKASRVVNRRSKQLTN